MKKTKKTFWVLMMLCILLGLCGCGNPSTNSKAKKIAQEYINEKYGQDAKLVTVKENFKFTGPGGGLLPTGIESDDSYSLIMEMDGRQFDVCLIGSGSDYIGYDNYEEDRIKADVTAEVESLLDIRCEDLFLSYGEIYEKYGSNMIHESYEDLASIYENGKFAGIVATCDSIDADYVEEYADKYSVTDEKKILRIEIIQYEDVIPTLSFSSFSEVNDPQYVLDWYTISKGSVEHHDD